MKSIFYILFVLMFVTQLPAEAQVDKKDVRRGNRDFKKENWREAEIDYRKALVKDSLSLAAAYNLANTLYREGDAEQAQKIMETVKEIAPASVSAADYYYNLGDLAIARQDWQGAVDAFKESLLRNPGDLNAKENYIYARKKLQDQQQNQQNDQNNQDQNQDNQDNQDNQGQNDQKNQDDKDQQDQNKDQQDKNKDQQDQNDQKNQDQPQSQQGQQPKITPQAAQQMLQAIQAKEKETQDKVNKQKAEALNSRQKDKNW
ncbi:MAG: tetratricopeptide repeat protein [Bacteroidales bacterium]|nr:tetratricopeptide repeat protein [Bacteroidales bacterium]